MRVVNIVVLVLLIYLVFAFSPGFFCGFSIFTRQKSPRITRESIQGTYYEPFGERVLSDKEMLQALPSEEIAITARDGVELKGTYIDNHSDKTVVFFHGYKVHYMDQFSVVGRLLYEKGYNLMFTCQRAHGASGGKYTTLGIIEQDDVHCWVEELKSRGHHNMVLYGMSMGSATVAYAASKLDKEVVRGLIFDCGFSSPYYQIRDDIKKWHVPYLGVFPACILFGKIFLKQDIRQTVADSLRNTTLPALFLHGTLDSCVPFQYGKENYECYGGPKEKLFVEGADHTVSLLAGGKEAEETVRRFVDKVMS